MSTPTAAVNQSKCQGTVSSSTLWLVFHQTLWGVRTGKQNCIFYQFHIRPTWRFFSPINHRTGWLQSRIETQSCGVIGCRKKTIGDALIGWSETLNTLTRCKHRLGLIVNTETSSRSLFLLLVLLRVFSRHWHLLLLLSEINQTKPSSWSDHVTTRRPTLSFVTADARKQAPLLSLLSPCVICLK